MADSSCYDVLRSCWSLDSVEDVADTTACFTATPFDPLGVDVGWVVTYALAGVAVPVLPTVNITVLAFAPLNLSLAEVLKFFCVHVGSDGHFSLPMPENQP